MTKDKKPDIFNRFTAKASSILGRAWVFVTALLVLLVWAVSGPIFGFSDTWQLIINTGTTIVTFLMVFIIQNTQNRDNMAMNIKLDTIMKKVGVHGDDLLDAEDMGDKQLEAEKSKEIVQRKKRKRKRK
jgi:low affinity Fe/Cu permease